MYLAIQALSDSDSLFRPVSDFLMLIIQGYWSAQKLNNIGILVTKREPFLNDV